MPSSELLRCFATHPLKADSRESLLLGMPKHCAQIVDRLVKSAVKLKRFSPQSTNRLKYLTSQVIFMPDFCSAYSQSRTKFTQPKSAGFNLLSSYLCPQYTSPIKITKLN